MPAKLPTFDPDKPVDHREAGLGKDFLALVARRQNLKMTRDKIEADLKDLSQKLTIMVAESGHKTIVTPDWRVTFTQGTNRSISKEKLLEQGVSVKIIEKATKETTYETVTVTAANK